MTDEERKQIVSDVLAALKQNSTTIDQMMEKENCADDDFFETNKGNKISFKTLSKGYNEEQGAVGDAVRYQFKRSDGKKLYPQTSSACVTMSDGDDSLDTRVKNITTEYNVSLFHPKQGIDGGNKYTLETAIALVPKQYRSVGLKCSFINDLGDNETWEYKSGSWSIDCFRQTGATKFAMLDAKFDRYAIKSSGKNLFDYNTVVHGFFLNSKGVCVNGEQYGISTYIEIEASTQYALSKSPAGGTNHCFYDEDGRFISAISDNASQTQILETPDNAKYIRISVLLSYTKVQLEKGNSVTTFQEYTQTYKTDNKIKKIGVDIDKCIVSKCGKNILNPDTFIVGEWVSSRGYIEKVGYGIGRTPFIPIKEGESLTCSSKKGFQQCRASLYDANFTPIVNTVTTDENVKSRTLTWVEGAEYAVFTFRSAPSNENEDMVEYSTEVTVFEPYYWNKDIQKKLNFLSTINNNTFEKIEYNRNVFTQSGFLGSNGVISVNKDFICTDYIEIEANSILLIKTRAVWDNLYGGGMAFYDENKKIIKSIYDTITASYPGVGEYDITEIPSNAKYIILCGATSDMNQYLEIYSITDLFYKKIQNIYAGRKTMTIKTTDNDVEILEKMIKCFEEGNYDVYFETGEYIFQEAYIYMRDILKWVWTMEFPIGNNCHYYLNNSVIKSIPPAETYETSRNVFGTRASASNFELHDGTIINQGGTYCVHDEANTDDSSYIHK